MRLPRSTLGVFACLRYAVLTLSTAHALRADLPAGAQIVAGSANISTAANAMSIRQNTPNAIINWQSFNIGRVDRVNLQQPSAQAAMLARVVGNDPSKLLGGLSANGSLFLINPNGVLVGSGAVIDTNHFVASTLDVSDADFLSGRGMTFKGDSTAGIINLGTITANEGNVLLFGHTVTNAGSITAEKGTVGLAAASEVFLAAPNAPGIVVKTNLSASTAKTGVENSGMIQAAQAQLEAAGGSVYDLAINQTGQIRATGVEQRGGRVFLTADGGTVGVGGGVSARNADGTGGEILIGGDYRGGNPAVANAARTVVTADAVLDASATSATGQGGRVIVWADEATRFLGKVAAKAGANGGHGGFVEVSGKEDLDFRPAAPIDLSAPAGQTGTLLLDPAALTISSGTTNNVGTSGTNPFVFTKSGTSPVLNVATLAAQLNSTNVTLETSTSSGDVAFNSALAWTSNNALRVNSGSTISVNADITGGATSGLTLYSGKDGFSTLDGLITSGITQAAASTITVGTLTVGVNTAAAVPGTTYGASASGGNAQFNGVLHVGTLQRDLSGNFGVLFAQNSGNAIDTFRTTGAGGASSGFQVVDGAGSLDVMLAMNNVDSGYMEFTTPGTLTLLSGSSVSLQSQNDVVFATTAGNFINQAGASPFGTNVRYLIYSGTTAGTLKGGLTGTNEFNRTFAGDLPSTFNGDTTSRFLFRASAGSPILTYTADNKSRIYAAADPTFTAAVSGLQGGDVLANVVTGAPAFSTTATQSSGVGSYAINVIRNTLNSATYDFAFVPGTLSVTPAPLTITANDFSRTINTANPTFTANYSGFVLGQNSSVVGGLQFATTAVLASPAGTYPITPSGATAANYSITFVPGTLTVSSTAPLTITANNFSRTYGAANPSFTAAFSGLIGGDTPAVVTGLQFSTTTTQSSGVGAYAITPFGATATGYVITYVPGTLTINPASLTLSASPVSRVYGDANPALTPTFTGLVAGDTSAVVSGLTLGTSATAGSNAGAYAITVSGGTAANYNITRVNSTLTVTPATLTISADDKTRAYGDANPAFTYTVSGLKNGDAANAAFSFISAPFTLATPTDTIGQYGIFVTGVSNSANYTTNFASGSLRITQRPLTITADNKTKAYGDPYPALTASFSGLASFDTAGVIPNLRLSLPSGVRDGVQTLGIFVDSGGNQNYSISYKTGQLTITPASLFTGQLLDWTRIYGRATPDAPVPTVGGLVAGDTFTDLKLSYTNVPGAQANAGSYTYGLAIGNPNYKFASNPTGTFRVDPAPLTIQLGGGSRLYGDANPASYGTRVQGVVTAFGDTVDSVLKIVNPAADRTMPAGAYTLFPQILSPNYTLGSVTEGAFTVFPRNVSITIDNQARYYGEPNPTFSYRIGGDGLASFDTAQSLIATFGLDQTVTATTNVGRYPLNLTLAGNSNYKVAPLTPAALVILPRPVEVYVRNAVGYLNDSQPTGFDAAALGLDFVTNASGPGFSAVFAGLPDGVSVAQAFPNLSFESRATTGPSAVGTAVTKLSDIFAGDTRTLQLPALTLVSSTSKVSGVQLGAAIDPNSVTLGEKTFSDTVMKIVPTRLDNSNYVVTTIVQGQLTWKGDRNVTEQMISDQLFKVTVEDAKKQFYWTDTPGTTRTGAFGFTQQMFPILRDLLLDMLEKGGMQEGGVLEQVFGDHMVDWQTLSSFQREGYMLIWLSDIHSNTVKQAVMLPALCDFAIRSASVAPEKNTPEQKAVLTALEPYLLKAQHDYGEQLKTEEAKWQKAQASAKGVADFMLGTDMLEDITGNAISTVTKQTTDQLNVSVKSLVEHATVAPAVGGAAFVGTAEGFRQNLDTLLGQNSNYKTAANMADQYAKLENELYGGRSKVAVNAALQTPEALGKQNSAFIEAADNAAKNFKFQPSSEELAGMKKAEGLLAKELSGGGAISAEGEIDKLGFKIPENSYANYTEKIAAEVQKDGTREAAMKSPEALAKGKAMADSAFESVFAETTGKKFTDDISGLSDDMLKKGLDAAEKAAKKAEASAINTVGEDAYKAAKLEKATEIAKQLIAEQAEATAKKAAMKEAGDAAAKKVVTELTEQATKEFADKTAVKILVSDVGKVAFDQGIEGGAKLASEAGKDLAQTATKITESKVVAKIATEGAETAAEKLAAKAVADLGTEAAEKLTAKVAAKAVTAATKLAGLAKSLVGGPAGVVEIIADLATQAIISGVERGDQEKQLHNLENSLLNTKTADPHEAAKTSMGQATMMMALLNMMGPKG